MEFKNFILSIENGVAVFTINRPEVRNALSAECWNEIGLIADYVQNSEEIKVAIITGAGDKAFAAGADIAQQAVNRVEEMSKVGRKRMGLDNC